MANNENQSKKSANKTKRKLSNKVKQFAKTRKLDTENLEKTITLPQGACAVIITPEMNIMFEAPTKTKEQQRNAVIPLYEELGIAITATMSMPGVADRIIKLFRDTLEQAMINNKVNPPTID